MKKNALLIFCLLCLSITQSQNLAKLSSIELKKDADFTEEADNAALECANYLLEKPIIENDVDRLLAMQYLVRWMTGTPDYSFMIDATASDISKPNEDLLGVYLAAMVKFCLEHPDNAGQAKVVKEEAVKLLLAYCESNEIKLNSALKKLKSANDKGALQEYLDEQ